MTRQTRKTWSLNLVLMLALAGSHPTKPFYFHEDGDLSHYMEMATEIIP
jgi:hypothetical protein